MSAWTRCSRALVKTGDLEGYWRIELTPYPGFGLLELRFDDTLVTGTYRFSNGDYGSVRGTYASVPCGKFATQLAGSQRPWQRCSSSN